MMKNIFAGLEKLGFRLNDLKQTELYQDKQKDKNKASSSSEKVVDLESFIYIKEFECPSCYNSFHNALMRQSMVKLIKTDTDLRPYFEPIEPLYYDVMLCDHCGYAAVSSTFPKLTERQAEKIREKITPNFKPKEYSLLLSTEESIERYKLALFNCVVKEAKSGEKAYVCLKIAWLYRAMKDIENEKMFLAYAFTGFEKAFSNESFPICGMDENTLTYLLADIARRLEKYDAGLRYLACILTNRNTTSRIKNKALEIKQLIMEERSRLKEAEKPAVPIVVEPPKSRGLLSRR